MYSERKLDMKVLGEFCFIMNVSSNLGGLSHFIFHIVTEIIFDL